MANGANMAVRFNAQDKASLREVAAHWCNGNQSAALRLLVRAAADLVREQNAKPIEQIRTEKEPAN